MSRLKVLVLPIFRHYWLWHPVNPQVLQQGAQKPLAHWRTGENLEQKAHLLGQHISRRLQLRLQKEWQKLVQAPDGSLRNWGFKMAQAVLSREDPRETFFKQLPAEPAPVEFTYPSDLKERLVRRRLRCITAAGSRLHRSRLLWWGLALVPQLPLMLTPLPNITVYYTGYRIYSHYRALQGTRSLEKALTELDSQQLRALREALLAYQETTGEKLPENTWPARLVRQDRQYLDIFDRLKQYQRQRALQRQLEEMGQAEAEAASAAAAAVQGEQAASGSPTRWLTFTPSTELGRLVRVPDRQHAPLEDNAALAIGQACGASNLLEQVARARKRCMGSFFPTTFPTQPSVETSPAK